MPHTFPLLTATVLAFAATPATACPNPSEIGQQLTFSGTMLDVAQVFHTTAGAAYNLRDCGLPYPGYAGAAPNFTLDTRGLQGRQLSLNVASSCDTTLLVYRATGEWNFNDDGEWDVGDGDLTPYLDIDDPQDLAGTVSVWIGSYGGDVCPASISMQTRPAPRPDPDPDGADAVLGTWQLNANGFRGTLTITGSEGALRALVNLGTEEPTGAARYDPETRTLRFARPNGSQSYTGVVTGNTISGRFTWEGGSYPWSASR